MARAADSQARGWDRSHRPRPPPAFAALSQHHGAPWRPTLHPVAGLSLGPEPGGACSLSSSAPLWQTTCLSAPFSGHRPVLGQLLLGLPSLPTWPRGLLASARLHRPESSRPPGLPCPACGVLVRAEKPDPALPPEPGASDPGGDSVPAHGDANNQESLNKHVLTGWAENPATLGTQKAALGAHRPPREAQSPAQASGVSIHSQGRGGVCRSSGRAGGRKAGPPG